jgi:WXG100 family type VII secretion target
MSETRVSTAAVDAASSRIASETAAFETRLAACRSLVESTIGADWAGSAADAFGSSWLEWLQGAASIQDALSGISRLLTEAAAQYESAEGVVTRASDESSVTVSGGPGDSGTPGEAS